jgi:hypothetical protein
MLGDLEERFGALERGSRNMLAQVNGPYFFVSCDTDLKCYVGATTSGRAEGEELVWILTKESCTCIRVT